MALAALLAAGVLAAPAALLAAGAFAAPVSLLAAGADLDLLPAACAPPLAVAVHAVAVDPWVMQSLATNTNHL